MQNSNSCSGCLIAILAIVGIAILFTSPGLFIFLAIICVIVWSIYSSSKKQEQKTESNTNAPVKTSISIQGTNNPSNANNNEKMQWYGIGTKTSKS